MWFYFFGGGQWPDVAPGPRVAQDLPCSEELMATEKDFLMSLDTDTDRVAENSELMKKLLL